MVSATESRLAIDFAHAVVPLTGKLRDDQTLFGIIGDAPVVLFEESTHGTHEFYRARIEITKRLISERGFTAVCVASDCPGAYRIDRYARGTGDVAEAIDSLGGSAQFPAWLWRNAEMLEFVAWMREYNAAAAVRGRRSAGFYGLDLFNTYASTEAVLGYFDTGDPARRDEVVAGLVDARRKSSRGETVEGWGSAAPSAEKYYRTMLDGSVSKWNLRDAHMRATFERLLKYLNDCRGETKAIVWANNAHSGDARPRFGRRAVTIGFSTYSGTVTAAPRWGKPEERQHIVPARGDSYEYLFHAENIPRFFLPLRPYRPKLAQLPRQARERSIGVVFSAHGEPHTHYQTSRLIDRYDALFHFDVTRHLDPI